jgi:hypothetical protein
VLFELLSILTTLSRGRFRLFFSCAAERDIEALLARCIAIYYEPEENVQVFMKLNLRPVFTLVI